MSHGGCETRTRHEPEAAVRAGCALDMQAAR